MQREFLAAFDDVMSSWDVTSDTGLIIGSQSAVDAPSCIAHTDIT